MCLLSSKIFIVGFVISGHRDLSINMYLLFIVVRVRKVVCDDKFALCCKDILVK